MNNLIHTICARLSGTPHGSALLRRAEMALAPAPQRRVLGVWWFQVLSGSIGDATIFHECLLCLMHEHGLNKIDVAFIDDRNHVNNRESRYELGDRYKDAVVSMNCVNRHLGSVFRFDSHDEYLRFAHANRRRYVFHPPILDRTGFGTDKRIRALQGQRPVKTDLSDFVDHRLPYDPGWIQPFFEKHGFIPRQSCRPETVDRVRAFVRRIAGNAQPVVVQVRNNPARMVSKNIDLELWLEVVRSRKADPSVHFFFIGHPEELTDPRLDRPNVTRSKDHLSTIEEDMALLQTSHLAIVNPGGLANFAWYSGVPILVFNAEYKVMSEVTGVPPNGQLAYYTPYQRMFWGPPNPGQVVKEFERLMQDLANASVGKPPTGVDNDRTF